MNPFELPKVDSDTLDRYQEDKEALSRFERKFTLPCQFGFLLGFAGIISAVFFAKGDTWPFYFIAFGLLILGSGLFRMFFSTPISSSGQPMKKFWNTSQSSIGDEVVYICDDSKTYFRRTWSKKNRNRFY